MKLKIADNLSLPLDAVTEKLAFLGRTGSGKTYAAQKLAEEMHAAEVQFVALDPVGKWWSLRLAANGKDPGIPLPVFGGLQGDVPLEPTAGGLIADVIIDRAISAVVDVSQFESDADKARFMTDFGARFYFRKKSAPSAVHLFIEEAQEFVPQNPQRDETRMLHVWTRIQKLGRNFGIGTSLLSQRPQEVNKKVLNQTEVLFVFQLTGPQERKTIAGWIEEKGIDEDIAGELPKLERGKPHAWSPAWLQISKVVEIGEKWTFDASMTPKVGKRATVKDLAPIDIEQLGESIKASRDRAKADDPKELRKQIAELKRQLSSTEVSLAAGAKAVSTTAKKEKRVEVPVLKEAQIAALERWAERVAKIAEGIEDRAQRLLEPILAAAAEMNVAARELAGVVQKKYANASTATIAVPRDNPKSARSGARPVDRASRPTSRVSVPAGEGPLPPGELATLTAALQYPGLDRKRLGVLTGYKRSSRDAYIARLGAKGLVETQGVSLYPTDFGRAALNGNFEPLPTGSDLIAYWRERLPDGERKTLDVLIEAEGQSVVRDVIDETTGYKRSSRDAYLTRLKARGLVDFVGRGQVQASAELFD